jgi:pentatricopeptide repeat protein
MIHRGLKPNVWTYSILLHGYAANGSLADVHEFLDLMVQDGISFDHYVFNTLICGYAKRQMVDEALQVFYKMRGQ